MFDGLNLILEDSTKNRPTRALLERRSNLQGRNIILCALPFPVTSMSDDGGETFYGLSIDIIEALSKAMNFSYSYVLPNDGQWGTQSAKDSTWNGMIGMLIDGKCDTWLGNIKI